MKLIFGNQAAIQMGVSTWFIASMKRAGAPFWGRKTDVESLSAWLRSHPGFVAAHAWTMPKVILTPESPPLRAPRQRV